MVSTVKHYRLDSWLTMLAAARYIINYEDGSLMDDEVVEAVEEYVPMLKANPNIIFAVDLVRNTDWWLTDGVV